MKCKTCETCAIKHTVHRTQCNFQTHFDKWITAHIHSTQAQDEILKQQKVMVIYSLHKKEAIFFRFPPSIPENLLRLSMNVFVVVLSASVTSSTSWITKIQIRSHARTTITSQITFISLEFPWKLRYWTCEWVEKREKNERHEYYNSKIDAFKSMYRNVTIPLAIWMGPKNWVRHADHTHTQIDRSIVRTRKSAGIVMMHTDFQKERKKRTTKTLNERTE